MKRQSRRGIEGKGGGGGNIRARKKIQGVVVEGRSLGGSLSLGPGPASNSSQRKRRQHGVSARNPTRMTLNGGIVPLTSNRSLDGALVCNDPGEALAVLERERERGDGCPLTAPIYGETL